MSYSFSRARRDELHPSTTKARRSCEYTRYRIATIILVFEKAKIENPKIENPQKEDMEAAPVTTAPINTEMRQENTAVQVPTLAACLATTTEMNSTTTTKAKAMDTITDDCSTAKKGFTLELTDNEMSYMMGVIPSMIEDLINGDQEDEVERDSPDGMQTHDISNNQIVLESPEELVPVVKKAKKRRKLSLPKKLRAMTKSGGPSLGDTPRKPRKWKKGTVALREIRMHQSSTNLLVQKMAFKRLIRSIIDDMTTGMRMQGDAYTALQAASESYLTDMFKSALQVSIHSGRQPVQREDISLVRLLRKEISDERYELNEQKAKMVEKKV